MVFTTLTITYLKTVFITTDRMLKTYNFHFKALRLTQKFVSPRTVVSNATPTVLPERKKENL